MSDPVPVKSMTPEEKAVLLTTPVLEVVPVPGGWGMAVDVADDESEGSLKRQYFIFNEQHDAEGFRSLLKHGFN